MIVQRQVTLIHGSLEDPQDPFKAVHLSFVRAPAEA